MIVRVMVVLAVVGFPLSTSAQFSATDNTTSLAVNGYLRSLVGVRDLGYASVLGDRRSGFNGEVARIKWSITVGDRFRVSVHNRLQATLTSTAASGGSVLGFGVSAIPSKSIDLEHVLVDRDKVRIWHDIDRLSMTGLFDIADVTVGRQAITWGVSNIFPVADLWAQFSPFELDTEEKPGLDAFRALAYPTDGVELDVVVGDRGSLRDLSAGARVTAELPVGDIYGAIGKFWRQLVGLAGTSFVVDSWKIRGEVAVPWDLDSSNLGSVRATLGADWIGATVQFSGEYHFNGLGASSSTGYVEQLSTPQLARGETYYLGRHYLGAAVSYVATDRLTLVISGLGNLQDPSVAWIPSFNYNLGQNARISAGGLFSLGQVPMFDSFGVATFRSEFGSYGRFAYTQFSFYF